MFDWVPHHQSAAFLSVAAFLVVAAAAAEVDVPTSLSSSAAAVAFQEETAVTNVDSIHTIETSFVTSTAV